ncbi:uncharacterized protein LOC111083720 isoform X2 [Limulus polyphemus]|uniref:Uncharacterized protein LOC111083720 isoform X2 n=1 Tax=Limulus polyphemus TaxID=6850 RepID=A0ABM1RXI8_LIMPO|nr:uncharacterized protein LOC111083720 isoform X2 [Limulus polyphemus]
MLSLCVRRFACSPYQHSVAESLSTDKRSISAGSAIVPTIPEVDKRRELSDETSTFAVTEDEMASWDMSACGSSQANHSHHGRSSSQGNTAAEETEEQEAEKNGVVCINSVLKQTSGK